MARSPCSSAPVGKSEAPFLRKQQYQVAFGLAFVTLLMSNRIPGIDSTRAARNSEQHQVSSGRATNHARLLRLVRKDKSRHSRIANASSNSTSSSFTFSQASHKLAASVIALLNITNVRPWSTPWMVFALGRRNQEPEKGQQEAPQGVYQNPGPNATTSHQYPGTFGDQMRLHATYDNILKPPPGERMPLLMALGGGTGASIGGTGSSTVDRDLLRRMHYQDKAVMFLVLVVYMVALGFSANLTYRQANNNSPVTYYADPRFHNFVMEGHELDVFLETFNQAPKNITLQVAGFVPVSEEMNGSVRWRGENFHVAFTFSLDLSPWVVRETHAQSASVGSSHTTRTLNEGMLPEDRGTLQHTLTHDKNDLTYVELVREVSWSGWEELATNIKLQIRQRGFTGVITVDRTENEELRVYKNRPWANFMHARATRVLCALSVVGWLVYVPYMWIRCRKVGMRSHFRVDVSISDYWTLIEDKLCPDGFQDSRAAAAAPVLTGQPIDAPPVDIAPPFAI